MLQGKRIACSVHGVSLLLDCGLSIYRFDLRPSDQRFARSKALHHMVDHVFACEIVKETLSELLRHLGMILHINTFRMPVSSAFILRVV